MEILESLMKFVHWFAQTPQKLFYFVVVLSCLFSCVFMPPRAVLRQRLGGPWWEVKGPRAVHLLSEPPPSHE